jgi:hypothetical protein
VVVSERSEPIEETAVPAVIPEPSVSEAEVVSGSDAAAAGGLVVVTVTYSPG